MPRWRGVFPFIGEPWRFPPKSFERSTLEGLIGSAFSDVSTGSDVGLVFGLELGLKPSPQPLPIPGLIVPDIPTAPSNRSLISRSRRSIVASCSAVQPPAGSLSTINSWFAAVLPFDHEIASSPGPTSRQVFDPSAVYRFRYSTSSGSRSAPSGWMTQYWH